MTAAENETVVRRFYEEFCNDRRSELAEVLVTPDFRYHDPQAPELVGPREMVDAVAVFQTSVDGHWHIDDLAAAEGNRVVVRWTGAGTHRGELMGIPPTGRSVRVSALALFRMEGGKIAEAWTVWDTLGMLQQLGVVSTPSAAAGLATSA